MVLYQLIEIPATVYGILDLYVDYKLEKSFFLSQL